MKTLIIFLVWIGSLLPVWMIAFSAGRYIHKTWIGLIILVFFLISHGIIWLGYIRPWLNENF